jgi:CheY-like chemotaxis protein
LTVTRLKGDALGMARILIVEDHIDSRDAMSEILRRKGYEVDVAANGREALAIVIDHTPDVMLLDLALPEMDGVRVIEVIRSYHRLMSLPVIVLTGLVMGKLVEEAKSLNISSMLLKSTASYDQIIAAIQQALAKPAPGARLHRPEKWRGDSISPL